METDRFPRVAELLGSGAFTEDHFASSLRLSDPIVPAFEYFLSLDAVTGFEEKVDDVLTLQLS